MIYNFPRAYLGRLWAEEQLEEIRYSRIGLRERGSAGFPSYCRLLKLAL
jgi:hypothetical protein